MSQELNDFIGQLSAIRNNDVISVYVPTLKSECEFLSINMKQQKDLLKSISDGATGLINFNRTLLDIITENAVDKSLVFSSLDRYSILLELRKVSLGNDIKINDKSYQLSSLPKSKDVELCKLSNTLSCKGIKLEVGCPSLKKDMEFLGYSLTDIKKVKADDLTDSVAVMYTLELIKFIDKISFKDTEIKFADLSINEKKNVIDNLPIQLIQKLMKFISSIRDVENKFITFDDDTIVQFNTLFFPTD
jgi:hypothetical protein